MLMPRTQGAASGMVKANEKVEKKSCESPVWYFHITLYEPEGRSPSETEWLSQAGNVSAFASEANCTTVISFPFIVTTGNDRIARVVLLNDRRTGLPATTLKIGGS